MQYRMLGRTGMRVSEVGFGAWGIGGQSYGHVDRRDALRALAAAEELGCNFVDTAGVYGQSEDILGEFLSGGRRDRWHVATKYSGQDDGLVSTVESQLRRLRIETIDFYQLHWVPRERDGLYEDLRRLKADGKIRAAGVSLYTADDIDYVRGRSDLDGFQVACSLLDPEPLTSRREALGTRGLAVLVRSALRSGFLAGLITQETCFDQAADERGKMSRDQIRSLLESVERFRFLEEEGGALLLAAARYPLSFPETSTVLLGTKTEAQARMNFGEVPGSSLDDAALERIRTTQRELGLLGVRAGPFKTVTRLLRRALGR